MTQQVVAVVKRTVEEEAKALANAVPVYSHIITNTKYNAVLAKRQLLAPSARSQLVTAMARAQDFLPTVVALNSKWAEGTYDDKSAEHQGIDAAIASAMTAMVVIAGVNLVEDCKSNADAPDQASALLDQDWHHLPDALRARVKQLAAKR